MKTIDFYRPDGKKLKIEIIPYRPNDLSRNQTPDRHRHNFYALFFMFEGHSKQEVDFEEYALSPNQVLIISKGSIHWEKEHQSVSGYTILFEADFFSQPQKVLLDAFLQYAIALRKILISATHEEMGHLKRYLELLEAEQAGTPNQNQTFILQNLMLALMNKLEGLIQNLPEAQSFLDYRRPFQRFIELVEENYLLHNHLDFYESELQLTKRKLNEICKRITGQTATNLLIDRIITEAKRELCFGERSIKEIAFYLGYDSQYYFSRMFKKRAGVSPEQFRLEHAE